MSWFRKMLRGETKYDFVGKRNLWFRFSAVLLIVGLLAFAVRGFNLSLDFVGGTSVRAPNATGLSIGELRSELGAAGFEEIRIEELDDGALMRVRSEEISQAEELRLVDLVVEVLGVSSEDADVSTVGPTFGAQIARRALLALGVFLAVVVVFISWRFELNMAIGAIAALLHDLIITFGVYALFTFEVTPATVVAVLTILGYSLYDTVVIYDKIDENELLGSMGAKSKKRPEFSETVNKSMNQVLMRSLATSLTSLVPVGSLLLVGGWLLGATSLKDFALALFVGIAAGTYSSIFIAAPLLAVLRERRPKAEALTPTKPSGTKVSSSGYDSRNSITVRRPK
jgi:preprotein translocase subunit SecF